PRLWKQAMRLVGGLREQPPEREVPMTDQLGAVLPGNTTPTSEAPGARPRTSRRARRRIEQDPGSRVTRARWYTPYLFMLPGLVLFVIVIAWPVVLALQMSVSSDDSITPPTFVGTEDCQPVLVGRRVHPTQRESALCT